jgi:hypothetical protein
MIPQPFLSKRWHKKLHLFQSPDDVAFVEVLPGQYLNYAMTASFQILSNSLSANHPTSQCYTV